MQRSDVQKPPSGPVRSFRSASIFEMHLSPSHKLSEAQSPDRAATDQFSGRRITSAPPSLGVRSSARRVIRLDHDVEKSAAGHLKNQFVAQARILPPEPDEFASDFPLLLMIVAVDRCSAR